VLMNPNGRAVDHLNLAVVGLCNRRQYPVPHTRRPPTYEPVVASGPGAVLLRQRPPRRAGPQNPEDTVQHPAIIDTRNAARLVWQQRRDHRPLEIRQLVAHQILPAIGRLNLIHDKLGIPFMGSWLKKGYLSRFEKLGNKKQFQEAPKCQDQ